MRPAETRLLQRIVSQAAEIERSATDGNFPLAALDELKVELHKTSFSDDEFVKKLAPIADHLTPEMTLRHFVNFMIPCERLLGRQVRDDEFLVRRQDLPLKPELTYPQIFILENLRSVFNVGSILRLADGIGASEIFLTGYTPTPEQAKKTALGSEQAVRWRSFTRTAEAITAAKDLGYHIIALETAGKAENLYTKALPEKAAWLVGNERFGLEADILRECDEVRFIPQFGMKNSLNVAVALGIAAYEWQRQQSHAH